MIEKSALECKFQSTFYLFFIIIIFRICYYNEKSKTERMKTDVENLTKRGERI